MVGWVVGRCLVNLWLDAYIHALMDGCVNACMSGCQNQWIIEWLSVQIRYKYKWMEGWINEWMVCEQIYWVVDFFGKMLNWENLKITRPLLWKKELVEGKQHYHEPLA